MTAKSPTQRRTAKSAYRKLTVSMPGRVLSAVEEQVKERHAASVSAYISRAVEETLERDCLQAALDEVWRDAPMTEKERAWADKILRA